MFVVLALALSLLVGGWVIRRRHRASELAGRIADRPTFSVEPPARRLTSRKHEAL